MLLLAYRQGIQYSRYNCQRHLINCRYFAANFSNATEVKRRTATFQSSAVLDNSKPSSHGAIDFSDHKKAFESKSFWELSRAYLVLTMCSFESFSVNSLKIFNVMQRCLGTTLTSSLVKPLFYNQFVGGVAIPEIKKNVEKMSASGSGNIVLIVAEAIEKPEEADMNHAKTLEVMNGLADKSSLEKYMQIRITALFCTPLLEELSKLSIQEREQLSHDAAEYMNSGQEQFQWLLPKLSSESKLTELKLGLELLGDIGQKAVETNTVLMVDAEYISINAALQTLTLALALRCNTSKPVVWNTIQCYLKTSYDSIQQELSFSERNNLHYGAKIVRGAYIVPEKEAARQGSYPSPVHNSYEDTNQSYDKIVDWLLTKISKNSSSSRTIRFILASHNKQSIKKAILQMNNMKIATNEKGVVFGQIYGMYDSITYTLGKAGYPALKSMPVGSVSESLPYLSRRAQENTAIVAGSRKERQLLRSELINRIKLK